MASLAPMRQLLQRREKLTAELRQLADDEKNVDADTGQLNGEAAAKFQALRVLLDELEQSINARSRIDDLEKRASGMPLDRADQDFARSCRSFGIVKFIGHQLAVMTGQRSTFDAGHECEISAEIAKRAGRKFQGVPIPLSAISLNNEMRAAVGGQMETRVISTTTPPGGPGASLIPLVLDPEQYIDILRPQLVIRQMGARVLSDLTGDLDLPRMSQQAAFTWVAENTPIPPSDESFDRVSLRPKTAGTIVEWSRNMILQSSPAIEGLVRNDLAMVLARGLDSAAIAGAGTAVEPKGIINDATTTHVPDGGLTYDLVADLIGALATRNALAGSLGFIGNGAVRTQASKTMDLYGRPLGFDVLFQSYPTAWSNLATDATVVNPLLFGNFADLCIGLWAELDLLLNPFESVAYSKGNVQLRALMTVDVALRHGTSFAWTDIASAGP